MNSKDLVAAMRHMVDDIDISDEVKSIGYILQVSDVIAEAYGLTDAMVGEIVTFEDKSVYGMIFNLEEETVGITLFGDVSKVKEGSEVKRSGKISTIPVGESLLGRVINVYGEPLDGKGSIDCKENSYVNRDAVPMYLREKVSKPLETGIKAIDGLIPIGKGQRELIIGDRHTGKSSIAIDTIINQKDSGLVSIYVGIGQKQVSMSRLAEVLEDRGAMKNTIFLLASPSDGASEKFLAPYAGAAIAEYFMDLGRDVLIIYDDLSKHASAYRELSLLLKRSPGREAYPGDIFYIHAKLLERAANVEGKGSITALPIVETLAGDISAYVPTNIISITDGQIYLESAIFNRGIKPAINVGLSVSRVGGDAQYRSIKETAAKLKIELAQYKEVLSFSQFSSDLDSATKNQIERGKKIEALLQQKKYSPIPAKVQVLLFYALSNGLFDDLNISQIREVEKIFIDRNRDIEDILDGIKGKEEYIENFINSTIDNIRVE